MLLSMTQYATASDQREVTLVCTKMIKLTMSPETLNGI